ncbi:MAG: hypothetical protein IJZ91_04300, partial [Oscillospiraceae bacterium]|nr:hypothetical protein [Oscillospiraceae bacterium]
TEAVEGSKVYGEITVKKYYKAVKDNKVTWGEGEDKKASVNFDRVINENTAVYKFEFTMPAQDTVVDYELADVSKVNILCDPVISAPTSANLNETIVVTLTDLDNYGAIWADYIQSDGQQSEKVSMQPSGSNGEHNVNFSQVPRHNVAENTMNCVYFRTLQ